jgi:TonB-dependent starch-binding outer membrane protein SusC
MKSKLLICLILILLGTISLKAQTITVTGIVKNSSGEPIPGVTVLEKNTSNGLVTDMNGNYSIMVKTNSILVFSFIGYQTVEEQVGNRKTISVVLTEGIVGLEEVVAIGYGSARKKDITGSVATVGSADFLKGSVTNAEQLIANKIPGVQVIPSSGKPGAGSSFLIRGGASLNASNDPLIVIDGVPIEGWGAGAGFLSQLNPNDIESFSILKDASASAIYGSRASNGVILITTNKGQSGKLKITASTKSSVSTIVKKVPVLSADQFREVAKTASSYSGKTLESLGLGNANTDWQDQIFQPAFSTDNSVSISGGLKNLPYRLSVGYLNQDGILKTSNYERMTVMLNLNPVLFDDHLKVNLNLKGSLENDQIADTRAISSAISFDPTQPVRTDTSHFGGYFEYEQYSTNPATLHGHLNPLGMLEQVDNHKNTYRSIGNIQLDYKLHFLPDLHLNVNTGYDMSRSKTYYLAPATSFEQNIAGGSLYKADPYQEIRNVYFESYANYVKDITAIKSHVDAMVGYSYNDFMTTIYNYPSYNAESVEQPNSAPTYPYDKPRHTLLSFYARANFFIMDKYLLTATIRDDASSRFSDKNRWGLFPSVAFAWKINQESFLKDAKNLSDLKLRLGYGVTGQQDGIGNYDYIPTYTQGDLTAQYLIGNTFYRRAIPSAADRNRKWEQTATSNIGLDFGFFNNRLSGSIDAYIKKTSDLLNTVNVPLGTDFTSSITKNIGNMENKGIEFSLKAQPVKTKDFSWNLGFNIGYNENKITNLSMTGDSTVGLFSGNYLVNTVGYSRNVFYLYHQVYEKDGSPLEETMLDVNNDGIINEKDRYRSESSIPKYVLGFNTDFTYKNWTASVACHANIGHYIFYKPGDNLVSVYGWMAAYNMSTSYYDTEFKMSTDQAQNYSDYYLQNASFLKIDNINISYNFKNIFRSFNTNANLLISASVQNVYTLTNYKGQDPENSGSTSGTFSTNSIGNSSGSTFGVDFGSNYPIPRVFAIGLTLDF